MQLIEAEQLHQLKGVILNVDKVGFTDVLIILSQKLEAVFVHSF